MSRPKVGAIGGLLLLAFIFNVIAVFTKNWIVYSVKLLGVKYSFHVGIVPYESHEVGWFAAASWMMFISFGLFFPLAAVFLHAGYKVHHHGCCHSIRHSFNGIALLSSLIVILQSVAFILMAVNASSLFYGASLGSSAYLALVSAIFALLAMSLAGHVSRHHCH